jgi:hypothetical protein
MDQRRLFCTYCVRTAHDVAPNNHTFVLTMYFSAVSKEKPETVKRFRQKNEASSLNATYRQSTIDIFRMVHLLRQVVGSKCQNHKLDMWKKDKNVEKLGIEPRTFSMLQSMLRKRHTTRPHPRRLSLIGC